MGSHVFLVDKGQRPRPLQRADFESERQLESYVESYPELLATALSTPERSLRLLLVETQAAVDDVQGGLPGRWAADVLFVDQQGVLTIVEDKLSTNPQVRRQVVGQMIEYSANLVTSLSADGLRERLLRTHGDADEALLGLLEEEDDEAEDAVSAFWQEVQRNLKAGAIRMVFAADRLPGELRQSIEFLNEYMSPMEVLGIEIARMQDRSESGEEIEVMVSSVVGRTERAAKAKSAATPGAKSTPIPRDEFLAEFKATPDSSTSGERILYLAEQLFDLGDLFDFDTYRTPGERPCCVVSRRSDGYRVLVFETNPTRTERKIGAPYKRWKWPEALIAELSDLLGFTPEPLARELRDWCGAAEENPDRLLGWLKGLADSSAGG